MDAKGVAGLMSTEVAVKMEINDSGGMFCFGNNFVKMGALSC